MTLLIATAALVLLPIINGASVCRSPNDPCMNDENHAVCLNLEKMGCESIQVLESCPLQFMCGDDLEESNNYNKCVTLLVYKDSSCSGEPLREESFPTWSHEGSPCYSDASMNFYSVKDQYCNKHGEFHQTVFVASQTCEVPWYSSWWSPQQQVFTKDSCSYGFKLKSCEQGPCTANTSDESKTGSEEVTVSQQEESEE